MAASESPPPVSVPDPLNDPPPRGLFTRLARVSLHLSKLQERSIQGLPLKYSDFMVLNTLRRYAHEGGLPVVKLARLVLRPVGSMTLILDRLEKGGLIERQPNPADRRAILILLTSEGKRVSTAAAAAYGSIQSEVLDGVGDATLETIDRAVRELLEILERHGDSSS